MTCNINPNGKIDITMEDGYEDGVFRLCRGSTVRRNGKLMNEILSLTRYPYSDNKVLDRWNELGIWLMRLLLNHSIIIFQICILAAA